MLIDGKDRRVIFLSEDKKSAEIIDQRYLPFELRFERLNSAESVAVAIKDMHLRGAPLIGAAAAYGMYLAALNAKNKANITEELHAAGRMLRETRPTAVNLAWAVKRQLDAVKALTSAPEMIDALLSTAEAIADEDAANCLMIGKHGVALIEGISSQKKGRLVNILTHCNAGALACVDHGTATSPIYEASRRKVPVHVWVDETRPRLQGRLTMWELEQNNIPCTVIADNTGGHLMQKGLVDIVLVGSDRALRNGDMANKIGTYLKALAAYDNGIPFYVALPFSTIDRETEGAESVPIEERDEDEVLSVEGLIDDEVKKMRIFPKGASALNFGFDVTPARLITGYITEKGICRPDELGGFFDRHTA